MFAKKKMETMMYALLQSVVYFARQRKDIVQDSPQQLIVFFAADDKRGPPTDKTAAASLSAGDRSAARARARRHAMQLSGPSFPDHRDFVFSAFGWATLELNANFAVSLGR